MAVSTMEPCHKVRTDAYLREDGLHWFIFMEVIGFQLQAIVLDKGLSQFLEND